MRTTRIGLGILLASSFVLAEDVDIPLRNWTVPPYAAASPGGMQAMTDISGPRAFIPLQPCRVVDTRGNAAPIQGGIFGNSEARNWTIWGVCGIPNGADAISVNITVVSAPATPQGGFLLAWPTGSPPPPGQETAIMTYGPGVTVLSNAAIVPLSAGGLMTVNVSHSTHIIMDVNGYFSDMLGNPGNSFLLQNASSLPTAQFSNFSGSCSGDCGVRAFINSMGSGKAVAGYALFGGGNSAAVFGRHSGDFTKPGYFGAGVRGESGAGVGVLGISRNEGVTASLVNNLGGEITFAILGSSVGSDPSCTTAGCPPPWGVYTNTHIGAAGTKHFLDPHPTDPNVSIAYISLEGPEAGTYFRGRARFQNGVARIPVPEHFRLVTDAEGLTVQITPIGGMASVGVLKADLNEIVVQASRNLEFSYLVQGVRATFKDKGPLRTGGDFMPRSADARMPEGLSPAQKRLLIQNGTYREDGTVNMETAQRLGWDRAWAERERPAPQPETP